MSFARSSVTPTGSAAGINVNYAWGTQIDRDWIQDSIYERLHGSLREL